VIFQAKALPRDARIAFAADHFLGAGSAAALRVQSAIRVIVDGPVAVVVLAVANFVGAIIVILFRRGGMGGSDGQ